MMIIKINNVYFYIIIVTVGIGNFKRGDEDDEVIDIT